MNTQIPKEEDWHKWDVVPLNADETLKFLLDDGEVIGSLEEQMDFFTMAKVLSVPPELLDFKCRILQRQGVEIIAPYIARGDFLKRNLEQPLS